MQQQLGRLLRLQRAEERGIGAFRRRCCHRLGGISGKLNTWIRAFRCMSECAREQKHTKLVADKGTSCDTTYTSSCHHTSREALLLLGFVCRFSSSCVVVSLMASSVSK